MGWLGLFRGNKRVHCPCLTCPCLLSYLVLPVLGRVWAPGTGDTSGSSCVQFRGVRVLPRQRALIPCFVPRCSRPLALRALSGFLCACCVPIFLSALMAYRGREEGGSPRGLSVGWRVGVAARLCLLWRWSSLCTFFLLVHFLCFHPRAVCGGRLGLVLPCHTLHTLLCLCWCVWAYRLSCSHLHVPSGLWYACFVAVVCSLVACGPLRMFSCGSSSYSLTFLCGLLLK